MGKRVLLVDDEAALLQVMSALFRRQGYETFCTTDGHEALAIAQREDMRVFVLDLRMPGMDGITLCRQIKKLGVASEVFAVSAYTQAYDDEELRSVGFARSFRKPFDPARLLEAVESAFEKLGGLGGDGLPSS